MKILKISKKGKFEKNSAEYLKDKEKNKYSSVSDITKDDILHILNIIYENNDIDFDNQIEVILDPAEKIIYENLLEKFKSFNSQKENLRSEISNMYSEIEKKYRIIEK